MLKKILMVSGVFFVSLGLAGCQGKVKEEQIQVKAQTNPLDPIKSALNRYVNGEPMGSEVSTFESLVAELRKTDATKADIVAKAFADIQKAPNNRAAIARDALKKLES